LFLCQVRKTFLKNYFRDFAGSFPPGHVVKKFKKCDFSAIRAYLDTQKNVKKAATDEEKKDAKTEKENAQLKYGFALVDGRLEKMGNFNMEVCSFFPLVFTPRVQI